MTNYLLTKVSDRAYLEIIIYFEYLGKTWPNNKIGILSRSSRPIHRHLCSPAFLSNYNETKTCGSIQITPCNFRKNVQSVGKRDCLVTLTPFPLPLLYHRTPQRNREHCLLRVKQAVRSKKKKKKRGKENE